jgi:hypothetical protein
VLIASIGIQSIQRPGNVISPNDKEIYLFGLNTNLFNSAVAKLSIRQANRLNTGLISLANRGLNAHLTRNPLFSRAETRRLLPKNGRLIFALTLKLSSMLLVRLAKEGRFICEN